MCAGRFFPYFFCHLLPPPFSTAHLRSSILRNKRGTWCPLCQRVSLVPPANAGTTPGGINFLPLAVPMLSFCRPSRPPSVHRSQGQRGHVSSFLSCVLAGSPPPLPPLAVPILDPVITHTHTHTSRSLSMTTNVAHLSNRWKPHWKRRRRTWKEEKKQKKTKE